MRDKLEGVRPATMTGVRLDKNVTPPVQAPRPPWAYMAGWTVAIAGVIIGISNWNGRDGTETSAGGVTTSTRQPREAYLSSTMEKVVVADLQAADDARTEVVLLGKGGLQMVVRTPPDCPWRPIAARKGHVIRVRSDTWRTTGNGSTTELSEVDAEQALCGDFRGRDVAVPASTN